MDDNKVVTNPLQEQLEDADTSLDDALDFILTGLMLIADNPYLFVRKSFPSVITSTITGSDLAKEMIDEFTSLLPDNIKIRFINLVKETLDIKE